MNEVIISPSKRRLLLTFVGCAGVIALGIWLLQWPDLVSKAVGILTIGVFGYFSVIGLRTLIAKRFKLIVDEDGIREYQQGYGLIAWQDIEGFDFRNRMMLIKVTNIEKYLARLPKPSSLTRWLDGGLELGLLSIPLWVRKDEMESTLRTMAPRGSINFIDTTTIEPPNL